MLDTRRENDKIVGTFSFSLSLTLLKFISSFIVAALLAGVPEFEGMSEAANWTLFILLFGGLLWITEAIPAFAVSLLVIALEIFILGKPEGVYAQGPNDWKIFLSPWSSPLVFLFFAGFIMAMAASKTKLDFWIAKRVIYYVGGKPANLLSGLMAITFVLSMFISNTATTAMMLTVLMPIMRTMKEDNAFRVAILMGVTVAANIGGMGTIIGTPPNAIAVGALGENAPSFLEWMMIGVPPALVLIFLLRALLLKLYPSNESIIDLAKLEEVKDENEDSESPNIPNWKKMTVIGVFSITVFMWLIGPLHGIPTTVISLLPVVIFTVVGIIDVDDIRGLSWDVLLLIIGGLSLGLAVSKTGLATWVANSVDIPTTAILIILFFGYICVVISNFMSNTAATNILVPIVIAVATGVGGAEFGTTTVIAVALSASCAMALPVSTPPNALVFASGGIKASDFIKTGIFIGIVGPLVIMGWLSLIL